MSNNVTGIYRAIMIECERRRQALGLPMDKFSEWAGLPDRFYSKGLHADAPSGRQAQWPTLQIIVSALFPHGFDLIIKPKPGAVIEPHDLKAKLLQLKAIKDPKAQRELMRELGRKGGMARKPPPRRQRIALARRAAKMRWSTPRIVEATPLSKG